MCSEHVQLLCHVLCVILPAVHGPLVEPAVEGHPVLLPVEVDAGHAVPVGAGDRTSALDLSQLLLLLLVQGHKTKKVLNVLRSQEAGVGVCCLFVEGLFIGVVPGPVVLLEVAERGGAALHAQHQEHCQRHCRHQQPT